MALGPLTPLLHRSINMTKGNATFRVQLDHKERSKQPSPHWGAHNQQLHGIVFGTYQKNKRECKDSQNLVLAHKARVK